MPTPPKIEEPTIGERIGGGIRRGISEIPLGLQEKAQQIPALLELLRPLAEGIVDVGRGLLNPPQEPPPTISPYEPPTNVISGVPGYVPEPPLSAAPSSYDALSGLMGPQNFSFEMGGPTRDELMSYVSQLGNVNQLTTPDFSSILSELEQIRPDREDFTQPRTQEERLAALLGGGALGASKIYNDPRGYPAGQILAAAGAGFSLAQGALREEERRALADWRNAEVEFTKARTELMGKELEAKAKIDEANTRARETARIEQLKATYDLAKSYRSQVSADAYGFTVVTQQPDGSVDVQQVPNMRLLTTLRGPKGKEIERPLYETDATDLYAKQFPPSVQPAISVAFQLLNNAIRSPKNRVLREEIDRRAVQHLETQFGEGYYTQMMNMNPEEARKSYNQAFLVEALEVLKTSLDGFFENELEAVNAGN